MNDLSWVPALFAGAGLGVFFFWGLWWTLQRALTARSPALWSLASLLVRSAVVVAGIHFVSDGRWERFTASIVGFTLARLAVNRVIRPDRQEQARED